MPVDLTRTTAFPRTPEAQIAAIAWHAARARPYGFDMTRRRPVFTRAAFVVEAI